MLLYPRRQQSSIIFVVLSIADFLGISKPVSLTIFGWWFGTFFIFPLILGILTLRYSIFETVDHVDLKLVGGLVAIFYFPINIGLLIIPIDELIFFRGVALAHQPVIHWINVKVFFLTQKQHLSGLSFVNLTYS